MSASSSPFNRCSISDSVLGVSTRTRDVNASSSRSCPGGLSAGENAAGNLATAISASLWDENFCSVSMNTTPDSSPPHDLGAAHAHASVRHICVFPAPAGPTSSLIDPVGTPPPSALSSASRCARTYAGVFFVLHRGSRARRRRASPVVHRRCVAPGRWIRGLLGWILGPGREQLRGGHRPRAARARDARHDLLSHRQVDVEHLHQIERVPGEDILAGSKVLGFQATEDVDVQAGDARQRALRRHADATRV